MTRLQQPSFSYKPLTPSEEQNVRTLILETNRKAGRFEAASWICFAAALAAGSFLFAVSAVGLAVSLAALLIIAGFALRMISVDSGLAGSGVVSLYDLELASTSELGRLADRAEKDYEITMQWKHLTQNGRQLTHLDAQALDTYAQRRQAWREQTAVESRVDQILGSHH